jgi:hypothetical protein
MLELGAFSSGFVNNAKVSREIHLHSSGDAGHGRAPPLTSACSQSAACVGHPISIGKFFPFHA